MTTARTETAWTNEHIMSALAEIKVDVGDLTKNVNAFSNRLTRMEAWGAAVVFALGISVGIGSCAVGNGYLVVPTKATRAK